MAELQGMPAKALKYWQEGRIDLLYDYLVEMVCKYHWELAGELYLLLGAMGCAAIDEDYEGDTLYPPPHFNAYDRLRKFCLLLRSKEPVYLHLSDDEMRVLASIKKAVKKNGSFLAWRPYQYIVTHYSEYEIGAARIFVRYAQMQPLAAMKRMVALLRRRLSRPVVLGKYVLKGGGA